MTDFTGKLIANTYKDILTINSSATNDGLDNTLRRVQDGEGTNSSLKLSETSAAFTGNVSVNGNLTINGAFQPQNIQASAVRATTVSATNITTNTLNADTLTFQDVSVSTLRAGTVSATTINTTNITVDGDGVATSSALASVEAIISSNIVFVLNAQASVLTVIAGLESTDVILQNNINSVSATTSANGVLIASNSTQINLLSTSITANESAITSINNILGDGSAYASAGTSATVETRISGVSSTLEARIAGVSTALASTSAALTSNINTVSATLSIANVSIAANSSAIAALQALTYASAGTSATLETRINSVSVLAETKASAATSATLETRIAAVSSTMATSIGNSNSAITALSATMATSVATRLALAGGTMTGNLILNADPSANLQAASKQYVDNLTASSIHVHEAVRVETNSTNLNATYNNGSSGVGATLTNAGTQVALAIDGVTLSTSDRVLVTGQTNQTQNGVYVVTNTGSGSTNWILTRSDDADTSGDGSPDTLDEGSYFFVQEGTIGAAHSFVCNTQGTIVFGTTNITFAQFSDSVEYTAGTGINVNASRVISTSGVPTNAELQAVSATMATSISNSNSAITALSATMATSIGNSNTNITTNAAAITSINGVIAGGAFASAGTSATLETRIAAVSATMATSIGNSNSAITALSATMATSINNTNTAITSINAATYRPNTALSATTGTFTGVVSAPRVVATSAVIGTPSQWAIYVSSNNLKMDYNGTTRLRLTTTGALQVANDLEAFTTLT